MDIETALRDMDFKEEESRIYLFLLKNPQSSQQEVSDNLSILRQTIYDLMTKMEIKGQISSSLQKKRKVYSAIDPKLLLRRIDEKRENFMKILPELESRKSMKKSVILSETFIGKEGLKNLFNLTLNSKSDILWMSDVANHIGLFNDHYWDNYESKRVESKVRVRLLFDKIAPDNWFSNKKKLRESKYTSKIKEMGSFFAIFEDKVIIYSLEKEQLFGVFIQNISISEMFKKVFEDYWKDAKEI